MTEYRLTEAGRVGLRMLLEAETLWRSDRRGLRLLGMNDVVDLPDEWVEPAPPPLPPEPEPGCWRIGEVDAVRVPTVEGEYVSPDGDDWFAPTLGKWYAWGALLDAVGGRDLPIRRLVPAPEPVDLPWHLTSINGWGHGDVRCQPADNPNAPVSYSIDDERRWLTVLEARAMAAALLSAADQAEAVDRG